MLAVQSTHDHYRTQLGFAECASSSNGSFIKQLLLHAGGMTMIDDDFPSMSGQTAGPLLANRTANMPQQVEAFPQLSAAATGTASGSDQDQPSQHRPRR